jgi:hypothetical protein
MSDIYAQKAKKYKLKYLKLKKQLEGGNSHAYEAPLQQLQLQPQPQAQLQPQAQPQPQAQLQPQKLYYYDIRSLCETSPPIELDKLKIKKKYPSFFNFNFNFDLKKLYTNEYLGQLDYYSTSKVILNTNIKVIKKIFDKNHDYTSEIVYLGKINNKHSNLQNNQEILKKKYENCHLMTSTSDYGYIIRKTIGKSFDQFKKEEINNKNIKIILENLKKSVDNFITKLYDYDNVLCIDKEHIFLKDNKIYYITDNLNKYNKIYNSHIASEGYYPDIIIYFNKIKETNVTKVTKENLIDLLLQEHRNYLLSKYNLVSKNKLDANLLLYKINLNEIFSSLDEKKEYEINVINDKYILPIAKNSDIYALCIFIWGLFKNYSVVLYIETFKLIDKLYDDANKFIKITSPSVLSKRLENILLKL